MPCMKKDVGMGLYLRSLCITCLLCTLPFLHLVSYGFCHCHPCVPLYIFGNLFVSVFSMEYIRYFQSSGCSEKCFNLDG